MTTTTTSGPVGSREAPTGTDVVGGAPEATRVPGVLALVLGLLVLLVPLSLWQLTQGTSGLGAADVWQWALGRSDDQAAAVVLSSRAPRLLAALAAGLALGAAGTVLQSITRNPLASPDTLAVHSGAHLALSLGALGGLPGAFLGDVVLAFAGGLLSAGAVLLLSGTSGAAGTRLVLGGTALAAAMTSVTTAMVILWPMEARGLIAWSAGSLGQNGLGTVRWSLPIIVGVLLLLLLQARQLDLLRLGDDQAATLGMNVRRTRVVALVTAVLLAATAVATTGPLGFVGLAAPALVRMLIPWVRGLHRHRALLLVAALAATDLVLAADVGLRAVVGAQAAVMVPTGTVTALVGGVVVILVALRLRSRSLGDARSALPVDGVGVRRRRAVVVVTTGALLAAVVGALLLGDRMLLLGDVAVWLRGEAGPVVEGVLGTRVPRVVAAVLAGAALAVAGTAVQASARNPLADPTIIGVSGGASVGAVLLVTFAPLAGFWALAGAAGLGALVSSAVLFGLVARRGMASDTFILVGLGISYVTTALVTILVVATDPFNASKALTWLAGSTYGRTFEHLVPLALGCLVLVPFLWAQHRRLDLISIDEDTPRVLGLSPGRTRASLLIAAVLLTGVAVAAIGLIGFVGLVAPHAARALVGRRHRLVVPLAAVLGALLVLVADTVGRTAAAPTQLPAGLVTALVGTPYFLWLLARTQRNES
ncbi:iron ABC transporter permease [Actinotalea sp. BY-33]|uniref:Iron ABC transporter permease n=1 Tax=Actinotalea soli TaxID=2819234 RepID=A0A939LRR4_9CELL|nr:iron ABC transporter permease [Actinotalea soli]MBO1752848.1 iron ABC transporter permease [Actinotalea soli]